MNGHHLILGELVDFITGTILTDTHDERYRQKLAKLLVARKGYLKSDIKSRINLVVEAGNKSATVIVDFEIILSGKTCMIIKYGPGSLVTRRRPALAASRLIAPRQVPVVVVTNGKDAEIIDGTTGKVISSGLESIPPKPELLENVEKSSFEQITVKQVEMESRIMYTFEINDSCPCDNLSR